MQRLRATLAASGASAEGYDILDGMDGIGAEQFGRAAAEKDDVKTAHRRDRVSVQNEIKARLKDGCPPRAPAYGAGMNAGSLSCISLRAFSQTTPRSYAIYQA